jgi:hypothetical protein
MIEGNLALFVKSNHRRGAGLTQKRKGPAGVPGDGWSITARERELCARIRTLRVEFSTLRYGVGRVEFLRGP